jgi:hypothetical protein
MKNTRAKQIKWDIVDHHICMGKEEALAVADAIYKLFKVN